MEILTGGLCGVPGTGYEPMYKNMIRWDVQCPGNNKKRPARVLY